MQVTQRNIMRSPQTHTHADSLPLSHSHSLHSPLSQNFHSPVVPLTPTHTRSSHEAAKDLVRSQVRREGGEQELMFFNLEMRSELKYTKLIKIPISKKERVREKKCQRKEKQFEIRFAYSTRCPITQLLSRRKHDTRPAPTTLTQWPVQTLAEEEERARRLRQRLRQRETSKSCRPNNNNNSDRGNNFISAHADVPDRGRERERQGQGRGQDFMFMRWLN